MNLKRIIEDFSLNDSDLLSVYSYGSRVYGTARPDSDYDYICVSNNVEDVFALTKGNISIHLYTPESFKDLLDQHKIFALECFFLPENLILRNKKPFHLQLKLDKLRSSLAEKSSHSWVKAKKKFADGEILIAKKSLFHSFRIIEFGIQLATNNKIFDFSITNPIWEEVYSNPSNDWNDYDRLFREDYNVLFSTFRALAPKRII